MTLARQAVQLAPENGGYWSVLGVAHYQAGDYQAAVAALEKSVQLRAGGDIRDWLFLALAQQRRGDPGQARQWYERASAWLERHPPHDPELRRFRAEALALLTSSKR